MGLSHLLQKKTVTGWLPRVDHHWVAAFLKTTKMSEARLISESTVLGLSRQTISIVGKLCFFCMLEAEKIAPSSLVRFLFVKSTFIDYV